MRAFRQEIKKLKEHTGVTYNRHHLVPRSNGGTDDPENISVVPRHLHKAWHLLFSNMSPTDIANAINDKWISKEYKLVCVPSDVQIVFVKR